MKPAVEDPSDVDTLAAWGFWLWGPRQNGPQLEINFFDLRGQYQQATRAGVPCLRATQRSGTQRHSGSRSELIDVKFYWQSDVRDGQQMGACVNEEGILFDEAGATQRRVLSGFEQSQFKGVKSGPRRALDPIDGDIAKATRPDLGLEFWGRVPVTRHKTDMAVVATS